MRDHEPEFKAAGANLAAIGLGDMNYARIFRQESGITFPLLVDDHKQAYRTARLYKASLLHLLRKDNAEARANAKAAGFKQHKLGKDPFQLGGSFVFGPGNVDMYARPNETFSDNTAIPVLLDVLKSQKG